MSFKATNNIGFYVLLFFIGVAFLLMTTPGNTLDSFLYFFSQSPMRIISDPITLIGLFFAFILVFLIMVGKKGGKRLY